MNGSYARKGCIAMYKIAFIAAMLSALLATTISFAEDASLGFISGKWITKSKGAMNGGQVFLFDQASGPPPSIDGYLRVPDIVGEIENDGHFSLQANPGKYYLVLLKRMSGADMGPPQDGDFYFFSVDKNAYPRSHVVREGKNTDIGIISKILVYKRGKINSLNDTATIEGTITDEDGNPVAGARVLSYLSPEMQGKPLYVSEPTTKDGKYLLRVYQGGTYFLKIRGHYGGGQPESGEIMGGYGEQTAPAVVQVKNGKARKGVDIKANMFTGRGKRELDNF